MESSSTAVRPSRSQVKRSRRISSTSVDTHISKKPALEKEEEDSSNDDDYDSVDDVIISDEEGNEYGSPIRNKAWKRQEINRMNKEGKLIRKRKTKSPVSSRASSAPRRSQLGSPGRTPMRQFRKPSPKREQAQVVREKINKSKFLRERNIWKKERFGKIESFRKIAFLDYLIKTFRSRRSAIRKHPRIRIRSSSAGQSRAPNGYASDPWLQAWNLRKKSSIENSSKG